MFEKLLNYFGWYKKQDIEEPLIEEKSPEQISELMRHLLGSIDLNDVYELKSMSEEDRKLYNGRIASVFYDIERDTKELVYNQLLFMGKEAADETQFIFARGTVNGLSLLLDKYSTVKAEHDSDIKEQSEKGKEFDRHKLFSELEVKENQ